MNLLDVICALHSRIEDRKREANKQIEEIEESMMDDVADLETALKIIHALNTACEVCEGTGKVRTLVNRYGHKNEYKTTRCSACGGTGKCKEVSADG